MEVDLPGSKVPAQEGLDSLIRHQESYSQNANQDEVDLKEIAKFLFKNKYLILAITFIAAVVGLIYAKSLPNVYKSEALIIPNKRIGRSGGGGASSLASQFGGVASLLGVNVGGGGDGLENETDVYVAIMRTRPFAEYTIREFKLMPFLAEQLNKKEPQIVKLEEAEDMLLGNMKIVRATKELGPGFRISFTSMSPELSAWLVKTLVMSINKYSQIDTIERAKKSIAAADAQLQQPGAAAMQKALWGVVSQKTLEVVLAQAQDDFSFRIIEPAAVPKGKILPHRGMIIVTFAFGGLIIGILAAMYRARPFFKITSS